MWGGGGGVASYPDPNVRNDDHRLQYVPTISAIRCETVEKWAKNCAFGAIIENKRVRARK